MRLITGMRHRDRTRRNRTWAVLGSLGLLLATRPAQSVGQESGPFRMISAGAFHTCALTEDGAAYCWGENADGALGAEPTEACKTSSYTSACNAVPVAVAGHVRFETIDAGLNATCGLSTDGRAFCWGANLSGALGTTEQLETCVVSDAEIPCARSPHPVDVPETFTALTVGYGHACALTPAGTLYCWGGNGVGQVGNDSLAEPCRGSGWSPRGWIAGPCALQPVRVMPEQAFVEVTAGNTHTCALSADGALFCWGGYGPSVLTHGVSDFRYGRSPGRVGQVEYSISDTTPFARHELEPNSLAHLAAGVDHTCGLAADSTARCWGAWAVGVGGGHRTGSLIVLPEDVGEMDYSVKPRPVSEAERAEWRFVSVTVGGLHACGLTASGRAYCWGRNVFGQLGIGGGGLFGGNKDDQTTPTPIAGDLRLRSVDAGWGHTCAVTVDGAAFCWGAGSLGQLGDGSRKDRTKPAKVAWPD